MIGNSSYKNIPSLNLAPSFGSNHRHAYVNKVVIIKDKSGKLTDANGEYFDIELSRSGFMTTNAIEKAKRALIEAGFTIVGNGQYKFKAKRGITDKTKDEIGREVSNIIKGSKS